MISWPENKIKSARSSRSSLRQRFGGGNRGPNSGGGESEESGYCEGWSESSWSDILTEGERRSERGQVVERELRERVERSLIKLAAARGNSANSLRGIRAEIIIARAAARAAGQ